MTNEKFSMTNFQFRLNALVAALQRCAFASPRLCVKSVPHRNRLEISRLQITRPIKVRFERENQAILQKNGGPTKTILHFFLCFPCFLGFFPLQPVVFQPQAAVPPRQKKSCQKHYRRFFVRSAMCQNRRMNESTVQWEMGLEDKDEG
jgi:hypothetical protein